MVLLGHCDAGYRNHWARDTGATPHFASDQLCDIEQAALTPPSSISKIKWNYNLFCVGWVWLMSAQAAPDPCWGLWQCCCSSIATHMCSPGALGNVLAAPSFGAVGSVLAVVAWCSSSDLMVFSTVQDCAFHTLPPCSQSWNQLV